MDTLLGPRADAPRSHPPTHGPGATTPLLPVLPPPVVPGYEIERELGRGGMGVVYQARQFGLNRIVALKMLGPQYPASAEALHRFCAEAEAVAQLQHPHIIPIYEINSASATPYFSMEFAAGGNLADSWGGRPHRAEEVANLGVLLALAVHAAHLRGIVHRDLKPANVLLVGEPGHYLPKLTDFGLAYRLDAPGAAADGKVAGTPGYMAPEQVSPDGGPATPATDVYALGVLLYEGLTGGPPCRGLCSLETLQLTLTHEPVPPSQLGPHVPHDLERICLKCLEKDPRKRYGSAYDLADDLQRFLAGVPIRARPTPAWERAWKWARRHPATAGLASLVAALALGSILALTTLWDRAEQERRRAEGERSRAVATAESEAAARREAQRLTGQLLLERGVRLCEDGNLAAGLWWLLRSLEATPPDDRPARDSLAVLLGGWRDQLHLPLGYRRARGPVNSLYLARQGRTVVAVTADTVHLWPAPGSTGRPLTLANPDRIVASAVGGDFLATSGADGSVRVWEVGQAAPRLTMNHPAPPTTLAIQPGGSLLAAGCPDGQIRRWDLGTGQRVGGPLALGAAARVIAFSPDGRTLAAADDAGAVRLWDAATGAPRGAGGHRGPVTAVAFSPDGKLLATAGQDRAIRLWDAAGGKLVRCLEEHSRPVLALAFSPDGRTLVSGSEDYRALVWHVETGAVAARLPHQHVVCAAAFSPDGRYFVTGSHDNTARLWTPEGVPLGNDLLHGDDVAAVAVAPDGRTVVTASEDGTARFWAPSAATFAVRTLPHPHSVLALAVAPAGKTLLTGCVDNRVRLWDLEAQSCREVEVGSAPYAVAFHPSGERFLVGTHDRSVRFWEAAALRPCGPTLAHGDRLQAAAYSRDGRLVVTGCEDGDTAARVWEADSGRLLYTLAGHDRKVRAAAFAPAGDEVATGSWDRTARRWRLATGDLCGAPLPHLDLVQALCYSPDGRFLLTAGDDYLTRLWDLRGGAAPLAVRHPGKIQAVAFSPDGALFATASKDHTARLWERRTGKPVGAPWRHGHEVHSLAFCPDGRILFSGSWDNTARAWQVPRPWAADGALIRHRLQVYLGRRLDDGGVLTDLGADDWCRLFDGAGPDPGK